MSQTFRTEPTATSANGTARTGTEGMDRALVASAMQELDTMRATIADYPNRDPSDILSSIAGLAGRLAEIRALLYRSNSQRCTTLRTREVDPLREDLDLQFRVHSRRIALMEWELKMSTGGT